MVATNIVDSVYERAASLGRDVFHYVVAGTMFATVASVPWWSNISWEKIRELSQIPLLLVAAAVLFGLGHVLLAIGFWIRHKVTVRPETWWDRLWKSIFVKCSRCHKQLEDYECAITRARQALPATMVVEGKSWPNMHVGLEMSVLVNQPRLHSVFIERYNTLWHLRLGLAASFLLAGVVDLGFAIVSLFTATCVRDQCFPVVVGVVGLVSLLFGLLLTRQHLVTSTNFLQRVILAFIIDEQKSA